MQRTRPMLPVVGIVGNHRKLSCHSARDKRTWLLSKLWQRVFGAALTARPKHELPHEGLDS